MTSNNYGHRLVTCSARARLAIDSLNSLLLVSFCGLPKYQYQTISGGALKGGLGWHVHSAPQPNLVLPCAHQNENIREIAYRPIISATYSNGQDGTQGGISCKRNSERLPLPAAVVLVSVTYLNIIGHGYSLLLMTFWLLAQCKIRRGY